MNQALTYRPEIDGLRAIAVSAVVLYHAGLAPAAGFVGVDVFFVISGYLITALLLREQDQAGRIDLWAFYARRVRRIFPAVLVLLLAVLAAGWLLAPTDTSITESAAAAAVFVANLFFQAQTGGYWSADAEQMPLLHLWSLSVEEQFYLLWPALLMLVPRAKLVPALVATIVLSLATAEALLCWNPTAAFYQTPARFWELAAGGLIAALPARRLPSWAAWAGLGLTLAACFVPLPHFPGVGALPAVGGAALLLAAIHGGARNALLASRPMVGIGLISYSLYLWHWPLLAFDRLLRVGESPLEVRLSLVAGAVVLAFASWRYVEQPFRRWQAPSRRMVAGGFGVMVALSCSAWVVRGPPRVTAEDFVSRCAYYPLETMDAFPKPGCSPTARTKVTLWGDSMAISLQPGMVELDPAMGSYTRAGCPPALGFTDPTKATIQRQRCADFLAQVGPLLRGDTLVMVANWEIYPGIDQALADTLQKVSPRFRRVLIVGHSPTLPETGPKCLALGAGACTVTRAEYEVVKQPIHARLAASARGLANVSILDSGEFFCPGEQCPVALGGHALYSDTHHISVEGARAYGQWLRARGGL